jgi:hypothetical protein
MVIYGLTSSNPTNDFTPRGTVLANPPQNVNNNNHHSIVSFQGNWYIAYHNRAAALANGLSNAEAVYKRNICLDALNYNPDGSIQQTTITTDGSAATEELGSVPAGRGGNDSSRRAASARKLVPRAG